MELKKISNPSRWIVAIASLSLVITYFVPVWRIDLFAPQYPEGLTMKIWLTTIKGEIDIINGLNHYIGMRHISVEMFPEFQVLVYIVAFYIFLGLMVAFYGRLSILFWYLIFTAFGGAFSMYDFYRWGYEYGHNLDPTAAIKVPGLSYQPPVIGHKRLLNFDAYSLPDIGGWVIIIAASIMILVWIWEYNKYHPFKLRKSSLAILSSLLVSFASCSIEPEAFKPGTDICYACKMGIVDLKHGTQFATKKGKIYKFDDLGCMVRTIKNEQFLEKGLEFIMVSDYESTNQLVEVNDAIFIMGEDIRTPMNFNTVSFQNKESADQFVAEGQNRKIVNWDFVYQNIK